MKQPKKLIFIIVASFLIVLGVNFAGNYRYYAAGNDWHFSVFFSLAMTAFGWAGGLLIHFLFFRKVQWTVRPTQKLLASVGIFMLYGLLIMVAAMKLMVWCLGFPEQSPQDYLYNCTFSALFTIIIGLMVSGQQFLIHLKKSIAENEQMKSEMIQSQYETLKNQVNPHFLFNSLNTLVVLIPQQPGLAVTFVEQMSKVFRYSLQHSGENTIDIETELKVVRAYLFLNEQRYSGKLLTKINIAAPDLSRRIITQALLMLVENAIKHNEISHELPLALEIYSEGRFIIVRNRLQRKSVPGSSTHTGLSNIRKRYQLATALPVVVEEERLFFTVKIPILE